MEEAKLPPGQPVEKFDGWNKSWILQNCYRWSKGGYVRYVVKSPMCLVELLGLKCSARARHIRMLCTQAYYDPVRGDWFGIHYMHKEIMEALKDG